jgi:hypothetical protein
VGGGQIGKKMADRVNDCAGEYDHFRLGCLSHFLAYQMPGFS